MVGEEIKKLSEHWVSAQSLQTVMLITVAVAELETRFQKNQECLKTELCFVLPGQRTPALGAQFWLFFRVFVLNQIMYIM